MLFTYNLFYFLRCLAYQSDCRRLPERHVLEDLDDDLCGQLHQGDVSVGSLRPRGGCGEVEGGRTTGILAALLEVPRATRLTLTVPLAGAVGACVRPHLH